MMGNEIWRPSRTSFVRIKFDKAFNKTNNSSYSGLVVRDSNGEILGVRYVLNQNIPSTFEAEALACVQGLQLGVTMRVNEVEVEGLRREEQWNLDRKVPIFAQMVVERDRLRYSSAKKSEESEDVRGKGESRSHLVH
ncbi:hypothetical protein PVK06_012108 [Gossypium arboreum]|uniref:RNase H type-1 domain-containing protein n=1 Tax=Gossypium arboreum TaxID=29729 RepID=A0ABR0QAT9_GOSAR|nr:hypothetical protein PVK06_012108 [Gossypium arboreum]